MKKTTDKNNQSISPDDEIDGFNNFEKFRNNPDY